MKKQEEILIIDLYKHYKSDIEISNDEINLLFDKYGNIRNILKNIIQEFEPGTNITDQYLDDKLKKYDVFEKIEISPATNNSSSSSIKLESKEKSNNKISKKISIFIVIGILLSVIIWLVIDRQKNSNNIDLHIKSSVGESSTEVQDVTKESMVNPNYSDENGFIENNEPSKTEEDETKLNEPDPNSLDTYKAIIIVTKTYFYETASFENKRKAFLIEGDNIFFTNEENGFVYVSFTNSKGKITSGWISKNDLEVVEILK